MAKIYLMRQIRFLFFILFYFIFFCFFLIFLFELSGIIVKDYIEDENKLFKYIFFNLKNKETKLTSI